MSKSSSSSVHRSTRSESESSFPEGTFRRSQRLMSQMLSMLIPTSVDDMMSKYPALLDVPFISETEIIITREIGSGSFGRVFHGIFSFQDVAVKRLTVRNFRDELDLYDQIADADSDQANTKAMRVAETLLALEKEVSLLKRISFPKVVGFYGVCFEPPAIVTEYCARGSLFDLIGRARSSPRVARELSWERRLRLANDAAIGMNFLHKDPDPIIHRDLKSPNLLVDEHYQCKVADFNTAGFVNATEISKSQANNPRWLAPEIADSKPHTKASDVYPFGIIMWELMTWLIPFECDGEHMTNFQILIGIVNENLRPEIPPNDASMKGGVCPVYKDYVDLMVQCWDSDPEKRPSYSEIHSRLEKMINFVSSSKTDNESPIRKIKPVREKSPPPPAVKPRRSRSPFSNSPSQSPPPKSPSKESTTSKPLSESVSDAATSPKTRHTRDLSGMSEGTDETCLISPFQQGPPSNESSIPKDNKLGKYLSFEPWTTGEIEPSATEGGSPRFNFSDVVGMDSIQNPGPDGDIDAKGSQWSTVRDLLGIKAPKEAHAIRKPLERWDSLRTAIFGEPSTEEFKTNFERFLKGNETTVLNQRLREIENKGSPGLRILRALVQLREKQKPEESTEPTSDEQESRWSIVKHLMLLNLPTAVHPAWQYISGNTSLPDAFSQRSSESSHLSSIHEGQSEEASLSNDKESESNDAKTRARQRWNKIGSFFHDEDVQPKQKKTHSVGWDFIKEQLFPDELEETESIQTRQENPEPEPVEASETNDEGLNEEVARKPKSIWKKVRKAFLTDVISTNWDFLSAYARAKIMESVQDSDSRKTAQSKIRRLPVVDSEPPSKDKWKVVRAFLMDQRLGPEWEQLKYKVACNVAPPRGTEWEIFRWLFFENKRLRNQQHWILVKDLLLKTDNQENSN